MTKSEVQRFLKAHGYRMIGGSKHEVWENREGHRVTVHMGNKMSWRLAAGIRASVRKGWSAKQRKAG